MKIPDEILLGGRSYLWRDRLRTYGPTITRVLKRGELSTPVWEPPAGFTQVDVDCWIEDDLLEKTE